MNNRKLLHWRDNEIYGHGEILRNYCGVSGTILGHVQHGWNPGTGWELIGKDLLRKNSRRIVWGSRQISRSAELGLRVRASIGAPWLYSMRQANSILSNDGKSFVFFPMHGTSMHPLEQNTRSLYEALEIADSRPFSLCLFWRDFEDKSNSFRKIAEEKGIPILTAGNPESPTFLFQLKQILEAHTDYISNRVTTSIFYAIDLGLEVHLTDAVERISQETSPDIRVLEIGELIRSEAASNNSMKILARYELGKDHVREPAELAQILGLTYPSRTAKYPLLVASGFSRAARKIGI